MAFKAVLQGRQKLISAMSRYRQTAERGLGQALIDEGRAIVRASRPFMPIDTGNLHDSGAVSDTPSHRGSQVFVVAGFGGPAGFGNVDGLTNTPGRVRANGEIHPGDVGYAVEVHNVGPWGAPPPYPYLRQGLANARGSAGARIVNEVRRHTRGGIGPVQNMQDIPF
jgi:hypothetical protein